VRQKEYHSNGRPLRDAEILPNPAQQHELLAQVRQTFSKAQQIQQESASIRKEVRELIRYQVRPARRERLPANSPVKPLPVNFPKGEFTMQQLEEINSLVPAEEVRMVLGDAIHDGCVQLIKDGNGRPVIPLKFRKISRQNGG
jgi:hypothetical protein